MRNEAVLVTLRGARVYRGQPKNACADASLARVVIDVALANQLRPLERCLAGIISWTCFRNGVVYGRVRAVDVLGGRINKHGSRFHLTNNSGGPFSVGAKTQVR